MSEKRNFTLDKDAQVFVDKMFQCEKPCDSYRVCDGCIEKLLFQAGYNFANYKLAELETRCQELEKEKAYQKEIIGASFKREHDLKMDFEGRKMSEEIAVAKSNELLVLNQVLSAKLEKCVEQRDEKIVHDCAKWRQQEIMSVSFEDMQEQVVVEIKDYNDELNAITIDSIKGENK